MNRLALLRFASTLPVPRARMVLGAILAAEGAPPVAAPLWGASDTAQRAVATGASDTAQRAVATDAARLFAEDMQPVVSAVSAALHAGDVAALRGLRSMLPHLLGEVNAQPRLADLLAHQLGKAFLEGLAENAPARSASRSDAGGESALRSAGGFDPDEERDELGRWVADPSAGTITPAEARARLERGIDTHDVLGNPVRLDAHILEHWDTEGHSEEDQDRRLRRLPDAIKAVETPHEVWQGEKQTVHLRTFTDDKSKQRYTAGFIMEGGKARTFFHFDRAKEAKRFRKGVRLYVRP